MQSSITLRGHREFSLARYLIVALALVGIMALGGCGSTKVYTADKTIVYNGDLYNMGNVQRIGSRIEGQTSDGTGSGHSMSVSPAPHLPAGANRGGASDAPRLGLRHGQEGRRGCVEGKR